MTDIKQIETTMISVKDRVPEYPLPVLVHWKFKRQDGYILSGYGEGCYERGQWEAVHGTGNGYEYSRCEVDYWMPLPSISKKGGIL